MDTAGLDPTALSEEHIGFILGPRLNAAGRLADAVDGGRVADHDRPLTACILASHLETLNAKRRLQTSQVYEAAVSQIQRDPMLLQDAALVLSHPTWPAGIIGIVASRLVEEYGRPVVLLSTPPGETARWSACSVEGCNITEAIVSQAALLTGYGGHPMAAGLSLAPENIPAFRRGLAGAVAAMIGDTPRQPALPIDAYVSLGDVTLELAAEIGRLAPFGAGNPPLVLAVRDVTATRDRIVGRNDEHRIIEVSDASGATLRVLWWNGAAEMTPTGPFDLAFVIRASNYLGVPQIEATWMGYRQDEAVAAATRQTAYDIRDHRNDPDRDARLRELIAGGQAAIWREADATEKLTGADRYHLEPAAELVIWTTPPGVKELRAALERVRPERVHLFAVDPDAIGAKAFAQQLTNLVKHTLEYRAGKTLITEFAASLGSREDAVRLGLAWLETHGNVRVRIDQDGSILLERDAGERPAEVTGLQRQLGVVLAETVAYREHFRKAPADRVLPARPLAKITCQDAHSPAAVIETAAFLCSSSRACNPSAPASAYSVLTDVLRT